MKKALIALLVCVNVGLLAALMGGMLVPKADAQTFRGASDYLMISGQMSSSTQNIYVIDMAKRKLEGWQFDKTSRRMSQMRGRNLLTDFKRASEEDPDDQPKKKPSRGALRR